MSKNDKSDKKQALNKAMDQIKRNHGEGSIMWLGENETMDVNVIPTGILNIDIALGVGGIPRGRITEIYGNESSGKTTLGLHIVAEAQKRGGTAVFVDVEHALDPNYAQNLGVNLDELLVSQPDNGEQALEIVEALIRSSAVDVIVIDSVAALVPKTELEGEMGDSHVALQARLMSQALRKLSGAISESQAACIFINQIREKVGVKFGNPETTSGGRALKFYTTVRIELRRSKTIKDGDETIGSKVNIKVIKNKVAPPFRKAQCDIMYGTGISREAGIIDIGVKTEIIDKDHSWYSFGEQRLGQGRENVKEFLRENPEIYREIENKIRKKVGLEIEDDENVKKEQAK